MPRGSKTIDACAGHRTKAEKESRQAAEVAQLTGKPLHKRASVKNDDIASKEFNRIAALMKLIGKADAIYSSGINRYCELFSEIEKLKASKAKTEKIADELNEKFEQLEDLEYDDIMDFGKMYTKMLGESMKVDSAIMSKRKMMSDIEKENGWTVLSALRAVPKAPQKDENADVLAKLLAE